MLGFCHSWVVETLETFQIRMFLGKKGGDGNFLFHLFVTMSCPLGGLSSFLPSLAHSLGSTWKFQSIVVHLLSTPSRNMFQHGFPYFYPLSTNKVNLCFFNTHITTTLPSLVILWKYWKPLSQNPPKTLTPCPSCIFMSSLLLLMSNVYIFLFF